MVIKVRFIQSLILLVLLSSSAFAQVVGGVPSVGNTSSGSGTTGGSSGGSTLPTIDNSSWYSNILQNVYNLRIGRGGTGACIQGPNGPLCGGYSNGTFTLNNGVGVMGGMAGPFVHPAIDAAACRVLGLPEGSFGALIMITSGLVAVVAGALGAYKAALSTLSIGAGAWILRPIVSLFFPLGCGGF
jgi:hypothetical protein